MRTFLWEIELFTMQEGRRAESRNRCLIKNIQASDQAVYDEEKWCGWCDSSLNSLVNHIVYISGREDVEFLPHYIVCPAPQRHLSRGARSHRERILFSHHASTLLHFQEILVFWDHWKWMQYVAGMSMRKAAFLPSRGRGTIVSSGVFYFIFIHHVCGDWE